MTKRYAVIGNPVAQSLSPRIHQHFAEQTGVRLEYDRLECAPENFDQTVQQFFADAGCGLNVTAPHKKAAFLLADKVAARAHVAAAVNTLCRTDDKQLVGDNTDGTGLIRDLVQNLHLNLRGARILLLGAGGAARGVAAPLLAQQPESVTIANRNFSRAQDLVEQIAALGAVDATHLDKQLDTRFNLIINATAAGLSKEAPIVCAPARDAICYDLSYGRAASPFMNWAQAHGARAVHDGWGMLVEQAAESFYLWHQQWPKTADLVSRRFRY